MPSRWQKLARLAQLVDPGRNLPEALHARGVAGEGKSANSLGNEHRRLITVLAFDRKGLSPSLLVCVQRHW
jgi:hypothetical protein